MMCVTGAGGTRSSCRGSRSAAHSPSATRPLVNGVKTPGSGTSAGVLTTENGVMSRLSSPQLPFRASGDDGELNVKCVFYFHDASNADRRDPENRSASLEGGRGT